MDRVGLMGLVGGAGSVDKQECVHVAGAKFVPAAEWNALKPYERDYLRCYVRALVTHSAVLVGRSAARVQGMWVLPAESDVELALPSGHPPPRSQWADGVVYLHMPVPEREIETVGLRGEIRATRRARTAVDIARLHGVREGVIAMDSMFLDMTLANKVAVWDAIATAVEQARGKRGAAAARQALALCSPHSESPYETLLRLILLEHGIDVRVQQHIGRYRVDLLWGSLIIEVDGLVKFEDKPHEAVLAQLKRETKLREYGFEVIRIFVGEMLYDEADCVQRIREAKARADSRGQPTQTPHGFPVPLGAGWVE